jgi:glycosyltransferase involved in cell wall biosynthesis
MAKLNVVLSYWVDNDKDVRMHILFICSTSRRTNSSATIQNEVVLRGLVELGHKVDYLSFSDNRDSPIHDDTMPMIDGIKEISIPVVTIPGDKGPFGDRNSVRKAVLAQVKDFVKRIVVFDKYIFSVKLVDSLAIDLEIYDVMISASDPKSSHLLARRLIQKSGKKVLWIQYWGDPMYNDITGKGGISHIISYIIERNIIKYASRIIYVSPFTFEEQRQTYKKHAKKMKFVPQGFLNPNIQKNLGVKEESDRIMKLGYFGYYISSIRNIIPLYEAVNASEKINLTICGNSDIELVSSEKVSVWRRVPYQEVSLREAESDVLVCICNTKGGQIPAKMYYYAASLKPILVIVDGIKADEIARYLGEFKRFYICNNAVADILETLKVIIVEYGSRKWEPPSRLSPSSIARQIIDCVE